MQETEKALSIWQTPGSELQHWCLLKHLPMNMRPVRLRPDPLFEEVRSIWKLDQPKPSQQQVNPAWQCMAPVPQKAGLANYSSSSQHYSDWHWQHNGTVPTQQEFAYYPSSDLRLQQEFADYPSFDLGLQQEFADYPSFDLIYQQPTVVPMQPRTMKASDCTCVTHMPPVT
jgi:hypothetical protein